MNPAATDEPIETLFGSQTYVSPRNYVLDRMQIRRRIYAVAAMRSVATITVDWLAHVSYRIIPREAPADITEA